MLRQDRVDELWNHGVVVADDAGEEGTAGAELADEVRPEFVLDRSMRDRAGANRFTQGAEGRRKSHTG